MRYCLSAVFVLMLIISQALDARAQEKPRDIIDKAIKAHGGEALLSRYKASESKGKGNLYIMGQTLEFTGDSYSQTPNQYKNVIYIEFMGQKITQTQTINGDKIAISANGMAIKIDDTQREDMKEQIYADQVSDLLVLKDKMYELAPLPETKVNGQPAVGVKVSSKAHRDVILYFDKASGLLVKEEARALDPAMKEVMQEKIFGDYKDFQGTKRPTKITINHDGQKFLDMQVTEFKNLEKLDSSVFDG